MCVLHGEQIHPLGDGRPVGDVVLVRAPSGRRASTGGSLGVVMPVPTSFLS